MTFNLYIGDGIKYCEQEFFPVMNTIIPDNNESLGSVVEFGEDVVNEKQEE